MGGSQAPARSLPVAWGALASRDFAVINVPVLVLWHLLGYFILFVPVCVAG